MSRPGHVHYRNINPDPVYHSLTVAKLINRVMKDGLKTVATRQVYTALDLLKAQTNQDPVTVLETAIQNISPQMEVRSRRVGGAAYQVPTPVRGRRAFSLAIRWLVVESRGRPNKEYHTFAQKLAAEIIAAARNEGGAVQRKLAAHRQAEANKAFAHFRW